MTSKAWSGTRSKRPTTEASCSSIVSTKAGSRLHALQHGQEGLRIGPGGLGAKILGGAGGSDLFSNSGQAEILEGYLLRMRRGLRGLHKGLWQLHDILVHDGRLLEPTRRTLGWPRFPHALLQDRHNEGIVDIEPRHAQGLHDGRR